MSDPTDFPPSPPEYRSFDNCLRCQICGELFTAPVALPCGHSFCSSCIRSNFQFSISKGHKAGCPQCRAPCDPGDLRTNMSLREAAQIYEKLREHLLQQLKHSLEGPQGPPKDKQRGGAVAPRSLSTRSRSRRRQCGPDRPPPESTPPVISIDIDVEDGGELEDLAPGKRKSSVKIKEDSEDDSLSGGSTSSDGGSDYVPDVDRERKRQRHSDSSEPVREEGPNSHKTASVPPPPKAPARPGYVECPICERFVREVYINSHVDQCIGGASGGTATGAKLVLPTPQPKRPAGIRSGPAAEPPPKLCFNLLNDRQLRKKLEGLGLPVDGKRSELEGRYARYRTFILALKDGGRHLTGQQALHEFLTEQRRLTHAKLAAQQQIHMRRTSQGSGSSIAGPAVSTPVVLIQDNSFSELIRATRARDQHRTTGNSSTGEGEGTEGVPRTLDQNLGGQQAATDVGRHSPGADPLQASSPSHHHEHVNGGEEGIGVNGVAADVDMMDPGGVVHDACEEAGQELVDEQVGGAGSLAPGDLPAQVTLLVSDTDQVPCKKGGLVEGGDVLTKYHVAASSGAHLTCGPPDMTVIAESDDDDDGSISEGY